MELSPETPVKSQYLLERSRSQAAGHFFIPSGSWAATSAAGAWTSNFPGEHAFSGASARAVRFEVSKFSDGKQLPDTGLCRSGTILLLPRVDACSMATFTRFLTMNSLLQCTPADTHVSSRNSCSILNELRKHRTCCLVAHAPRQPAFVLPFSAKET